MTLRNKLYLQSIEGQLQCRLVDFMTSSTAGDQQWVQLRARNELGQALVCSRLPSHWRIRKSLGTEFHLAILLPVADGVKVTLRATNAKTRAAKTRVVLQNHVTVVHQQRAVFKNLRFLTRSGRGKKFDVYIRVNTSPPMLAVYDEAIKITSDGPRAPRNRQSHTGSSSVLKNKAQSSKQSQHGSESADAEQSSRSGSSSGASSPAVALIEEETMSGKQKLNTFLLQRLLSSRNRESTQPVTPSSPFPGADTHSSSSSSLASHNCEMPDSISMECEKQQPTIPTTLSHSMVMPLLLQSQLSQSASFMRSPANTIHILCPVDYLTQSQNLLSPICTVPQYLQ